MASRCTARWRHVSQCMGASSSHGMATFANVFVSSPHKVSQSRSPPRWYTALLIDGLRSSGTDPTNTSITLATVHLHVRR